MSRRYALIFATFIFFCGCTTTQFTGMARNIPYLALKSPDKDLMQKKAVNHGEVQANGCDGKVIHKINKTFSWGYPVKHEGLESAKRNLAKTGLTYVSNLRIDWPREKKYSTLQKTISSYKEVCWSIQGIGFK